jgi:UDP-N-acetylglucosamine 4,6-dehydratase
MEGGEIFIPKIPSMKLVDLFDALAPVAEREIIGIRPGEKLHEALLTVEEARHSVELEKYFVILPEFIEMEKFKKYIDQSCGELESNFKFHSDSNKEWITKEELIELVKDLI